MIKKLGICFLLFLSCFSFNPLFARPSGHHDAGRRDAGRHDAGRNWDRGRQGDRGNWNRNWERHFDRNRNWRDNRWYNQGYYPNYYDDGYYVDYDPTDTTYVDTNYVGNFTITSGGFQDGVFTVYLANGMAFQMSYPGYNPVGSTIDVYSQDGLTFSLVINGQNYSATRVK